MKPTPKPLLTPPNTPITTPKLTLNCPLLTHFLSGGIPAASITEIVAESGSGKTQIALQLLLSAQLPTALGGFSSSSLYLYTEFPFPLRRLRQLSHSFVESNKTHFENLKYNPLDNVLIKAVDDAHQLFDVLLKLDSFLGRRNLSDWPVKLIVIDSIAAVFRSEFENTPADMRKRSSMFFKVSGRLRGLAEKYGLAVVVTNQVVDFVGGDEGINGLKIGNLGCLYTSGRRVCAALGLGWANCVNTRLFISKGEECVGDGGVFVEEDGVECVRRTRRHIHVVFAPHLPPSSCEFTITREGVFGVESRDLVVGQRSDQ